ncbi:MAG: SRPBCC domain-containing protein [Chloroflexi bacterium]|nr:SRPBCC domain-containing protein [Chloroflexota bacterium]
MDFRVGGSWHYCMTGPDGTEAWGLATYEEIVPTERIQYRDAFSDPDRTEVPPVSSVTLYFEERGDGMSVLRWTSVFESNDARDEVIAMGVEEGAASTLENLERYLASVS